MKTKYCQKCKKAKFRDTPVGIRLWCSDKGYVGFWSKACKENK